MTQEPKGTLIEARDALERIAEVEKRRDDHYACYCYEDAQDALTALNELIEAVDDEMEDVCAYYNYKQGEKHARGKALIDTAKLLTEAVRGR